MPEMHAIVATRVRRGRRPVHPRRRITGALAVAAVVVGLAAGTASAVAATTLSAPASIANTASLAANSTTTFPVTAKDGTGTALPGATIYLKFGRTTGGGSASVGATALTAVYQAFVTDGAGQVPVTYRTPAVLPKGGHDLVTAANAATLATASVASQYSFTTTAHYRITPEPIGSPGSLHPSTAVPVVINALNANLLGVPFAQVCVNMVAATGGGIATVGAVRLTANFQCFTSNSVGKLAVTYTTPAKLPSTGTDVITAQDTTGSLYNSSAPHGYSFGQLAMANLTPNPIAPNHSLAAGATVAVAVTPKDAAGAQVAGATVRLSLQTTSGAHATVIDYSLDPSGPYLNGTPKSFLTHTKTRMTIYYKLPAVLPTSGVDRLVATVTSWSGVTNTTVATYSYGP